MFRSDLNYDPTSRKIRNIMTTANIPRFMVAAGRLPPFFILSKLP